jgi:tellurite resistance protein TerC
MIWLWLSFLALVLVLLGLDLGVFHRKSHTIRLKEALGWTTLWVILGLGFSGIVYLIYENDWFGASEPMRYLFSESAVAAAGVATRPLLHAMSGFEAAILYITGYLLEQSLSIDNIFVISMLMRSMKVPDQYQHRVLFWGILGAIFFRGIMIAGGVWFVNKFSWSFYIFGAFLIISGIKMMLSDDDEEESHPEQSWFYRGVRRILPVAPGAHGNHFFVRINGRTMVTSIFVALLAVELTDIMFAVDSVPAILGVTTVPFLVVTSNVFAIMGLRSLYFVLAGMMDKFHHLKTALAVLLIVIGAKMVAHHYYKVPNLLSLGVVVAIVGAGVILSIFTKAPESHGTDASGPDERKE